MSRLTRGYIIALIGITIWSTTGVLISYLIVNYKMPALLLAFWRNLLVCVALIKESVIRLKGTNRLLQTRMEQRDSKKSSIPLGTPIPNEIHHKS